MVANSASLVTCATHSSTLNEEACGLPVSIYSPLSRGISRFAKIASRPRGSTYSVHRRLVMLAMASHSSVPDLLKDLQVRILLKLFASTPEGRHEPLVLRAASLTMSSLIS